MRGSEGMSSLLKFVLEVGLNSFPNAARIQA